MQHELNLLLLAPLLLLAVSPAHGQLSDATGLVNRLYVEAGGHTFEVRTVSNFDVSHAYDGDERRLTLFVDSGLENNLGEVVIPRALLGGNLSFYLNDEPFEPELRTTESIAFVTLDFEGAGENRIDIIATEVPAGGDAAAGGDTAAGTGEGGGCLVATAAYGTELAPQVQQLREIRDQRLVQTESGRALLDSFHSFYYSFSPHVADMQRQSPFFGELVRIGITPMISSLSLLSHATLDSDGEVLGYGAALLLLNAAAYLGAPAVALLGARRLRTCTKAPH